MLISSHTSKTIISYILLLNQINISLECLFYWQFCLAIFGFNWRGGIDCGNEELSKMNLYAYYEFSRRTKKVIFFVYLYILHDNLPHQCPNKNAIMCRTSIECHKTHEKDASEVKSSYPYYIYILEYIRIYSNFELWANKSDRKQSALFSFVIYSVEICDI